MNEKRIAPYDVSMMLLNKSLEAQNSMREILERCREASMEAVRSEANKMAYEYAEKHGLSLWDVCLKSVPGYDYGIPEYKDGKFTMTNHVRLVPIEFDFEHSPSYWEQKYHELKKKIETLLNELDE